MTQLHAQESIHQDEMANAEMEPHTVPHTTWIFNHFITGAIANHFTPTPMRLGFRHTRKIVCSSRNGGVSLVRGRAQLHVVLSVCSYNLHMRNVNNSCRSRVCKRMLCAKLRVESKESCRPVSRGRTSEHRKKCQLGLIPLLGCPIRNTLKWILECSYKVNTKKIKIQVNGTNVAMDWMKIPNGNLE